MMGESKVFGLSKDVLLKRDILLYLDQQTRPISSQKITEDLNKVTIQTLLKILKELAEQVDSCYDYEELRLEINRHYGVYLVRNGVNFNRIFEKMLSETIIYHIFQQLILYRIFSAEKFCQEHNISLSTLRRNITKMNQFFDTYQVFLKIGKNVSITGKESQIRFLFFSFLYITHRRISHISWINSGRYLALAKRVVLACHSEEPINTEVIALWLFINLQAIKKNHPLENELAIENFDLVLPASVLSPKDWNYVLTVLFMLSIVAIEPRWDFESLYETYEAETTRFSIHLFEKHFRLLTVPEKQRMAKRMYRHYIAKHLLIEPLFFDSIDQQPIYTQHPLLNKKFKQLWQEWATNVPEFSSEAFKRHCFHMCYQHADADNLFPTIHLTIQSSLPKETVKQIQLQIRNH